MRISYVRRWLVVVSKSSSSGSDLSGEFSADPGGRERRRSFWGGFEDGEGVSEDFLRSKVVGRSFEIIIVRIGFVG